MALKDKLGDLSQQIAVEKEAAKEAKQTEDLKPIRAHIKKLEKTKLDLEMIKNSLDFKKETPADGLGMKEYATKAKDETKKTRQQLEEIATENKEALDKLGVKDIDELANNPEFAEEEEVVAYKQAEKQEEGVQLSDAQLKKRLASFDININDENFSYETASQEISQHLEKIDSELLTEKLKTPEGREETINQLAAEFAQTTKQLEFSGMSRKVDAEKDRGFDKNKADVYCQLSLKDKPGQYGGDNFRVEFFGDKATINDFYNLKLLPKDWQEKVDKYGEEIAAEALKKNYQQKIEGVFNDPSKLQGEAEKMRSALELINPEKRRQALKALSAFESKRSEVLRLLQKKSEELKSQGIDLSAEYASGYGSEYQQVFEFGWKMDIKSVTSFLEQGNNKLFPTYDFDKTREIAERRINELNDAIEVITNLKTEKDVHNFSYNNKSEIYVGNLAKKKFDNSFEDSARFKLPKEINYNEEQQLAQQFSSYEEAKNYLDREIAELDKMKNKIQEKLDEVVDYRITEHNLRQEYGAYASSKSVEDMVKKIEGEKESAHQGLLAIASLQAKLPANEELKVRGITVEIPSKLQATNQLNQEKEEKVKELDEKRALLEQQKKSEPWFGKDKWRQKIQLLEQEIKELATKIAELTTKAGQESKASFQYADIQKLNSFSESKDLFDKYKAAGTSDEVFVELQKSLQVLVDKEVPVSAKLFHEKLQELEKKLTAKA